MTNEAVCNFFGSPPSTDAEKKRIRRESALYREYIDHLDEYMYLLEESPWLEYLPGRYNQGWKIHLNVKPTDVNKVAQFLKKNHFRHKYLSGGNVLDGKIFTIVLGSHRITQKAVKFIQDELGPLLLPPNLPENQPDELLMSPGICGRFEGDAKIFARKIALNGAAMLDNLVHDTDQDAAFEKSAQALSEIYGDFYGGPISYYDPEALKETEPKKLSLREFFQ